MWARSPWRFAKIRGLLVTDFVKEVVSGAIAPENRQGEGVDM